MRGCDDASSGSCCRAVRCETSGESDARRCDAAVLLRGCFQKQRRVMSSLEVVTLCSECAMTRVLSVTSGLRCTRQTRESSRPRVAGRGRRSEQRMAALYGDTAVER